MRVLRYLWVSPVTLLGLAFAVLTWRRGHIRIVDGIIEAHGPWLRCLLTRCVPRPGGAAAMTLGHVILGQDQRALDDSRAHEHVHVCQYERWGVLFLPAYLIASALAVLAGGHYYADNIFEREATELTAR